MPTAPLTRELSDQCSLVFVDADTLRSISTLAPVEMVFALIDCPAFSSLSKATSTIDRLLDGGCRYFVCWGEGSESIHDLIDDISMSREPPVSGLTTTWHDDESANDTANFFLYLVGKGTRAFELCVGFNCNGDPARLRTDKSRVPAATNGVK
jgi:hypothetical protein